MVLSLLNSNWRTLMQSFGKPYMDTAMDIVVAFLRKFFETVPASRFLSDDLSQYAREE